MCALSPPQVSLSLSMGDESGHNPYSSEGKNNIFLKFNHRTTMMTAYCKDCGTPSFLTNTIRRSYLAARKGEGKHKMEDEVRTRGTEDPWWIFSFHADAAQRQRATSCSVAVCVTGHCRWASGEGGKGRALVLITENLQKAMAVCFQPHPDPVIMDALIITCLLKLKNRGQKFTLHTQHCSCEL